MRLSTRVFSLAPIFCAVLFSASLASSAATPVFLNLPQYAGGAQFQYFVEADVNGDGKPDLVAFAGPTVGGTQTPNAIKVALGNGTGGFASPVSSPISGINGIVVASLTVGDFNGDGRPDVAFAGIEPVTGSAAVAVMLGNGGGTFATPKITTVPAVLTPPSYSGIVSLSAGDFNGDKKLDLAAVGPTSGPDNSLLILEGKEDGTFSAPVITTSSTEVDCVATGDFNRDGNEDVVLQGNYQGGKVLLGKGNGTFESPIVIDTLGSCPTRLVVADVNGDGNPDIVLSGGKFTNYMEVLLGDGTGHFKQQNYTICNQSPNSTNCSYAVADFNGDGKPDIAAFDHIANEITVLLNSGGGSFTVGKTFAGDSSSGDPGLVAASLQAGKPVDIVLQNAATGVSVLVGNGDGTFQGHTVTRNVGGDLRVSDFNNDHKPDILTIPTANVLLGNGDGTFVVKANTAAGCDLSDVAIGDFNGDGKSDIVGMGSNSSDQPAIVFCKGNGDGTFTFGDYAEQGIRHNAVLPSDFNNDGKLDLVVSDQGGIGVLLGNGNGTFGSETTIALNASFPTIAVGDFNADGKLDIAALTNDGIVVILGNGNGTFKTSVTTPFTANTFIPWLTVADINRDGKPDLLLAQAAYSGVSAGVYVFLGKGDGTFQAPVLYSIAGTSSRAVSADFNGDGNPDIAIVAGGGVSLLLGDGTGKLGTPTVYRIQAAPGLNNGIVTSDFNGDKAIDIAVTSAGGVATLLNLK